MDEHVEAGESSGVGIGMSVTLFEIGLVVFVVAGWRFDAYVYRLAGWGTTKRSEQIRRGEESKRDCSRDSKLEVYMATHSKAKSR